MAACRRVIMNSAQNVHNGTSGQWFLPVINVEVGSFKLLFYIFLVKLSGCFRLLILFILLGLGR